jgi:hypothetical protein
LDLKEAEESMKALVDLTTSLEGVSTVTDIPTYTEWFKGWVAGTASVQDSKSSVYGIFILIHPFFFFFFFLTASWIAHYSDYPSCSRQESRNYTRQRGDGRSVDECLRQLRLLSTPYGFNGTKGLDTSVNPIWRLVLYQVIILRLNFSFSKDNFVIGPVVNSWF